MPVCEMKFLDKYDFLATKVELALFKVIIKRGEKAAEYYAYCEEGEPVCLWAKAAYTVTLPVHCCLPMALKQTRLKKGFRLYTFRQRGPDCNRSVPTSSPFCRNQILRQNDYMSGSPIKLYPACDF